MKTASFDLETSNLNANFGIVLCGVVKPFQGKAKVFRGDQYPTWKSSRSNDTMICKDILQELQKYDILVAHNGVRFDIPFLTTRLVKEKVIVPSQKIVDPVRIARRKLKMSYNSLSQLASYFGLGEKSGVDGQLWLTAALDGSKKAMDEIVKHCVVDVQLLEDLYDRLRPFVSNIDSKGSDR